MKSKAAELRKLRRELEALQKSTGDEPLKMALANIDHPDRWIRFAARIVLENQPPVDWQDEVLKSGSPTGLLALARVGDSSQRQKITTLLNTQPLEELGGQDLLLMLRVYEVAFTRMGAPDGKERAECIAKLDPLYPNASGNVNHELCELLIYLKAPKALDKTLVLLDAAEDSRDLSEYLLYARYVEEGWDLEKRRRYLEGLGRFEKIPGGRWYVLAADNLRKEVAAAMSEEERTVLAEQLKKAAPEIPPPAIDGEPAKLVKAWQMSDFSKELGQAMGKRSIENGRKAYLEAQCAVCHRMAAIEATASSVLGSDLTGVGGRFGLGDLLEAIIHPSRVIGDTYRNPAGPNVSLMPPGLINGLEKDEVLDLLAYLQAGGKN